jgi:arylsulfatase A-like enzyme
MRNILATAALAALLPAQEVARTRPNIVFVFSDDHAPQAISAYGSTINATPNIDRLAAEGMLFRQSFCGNSICGPSRATIQTGLHSHANGFRQNGDRFDGSQTTFPKLLQAAGYTTAMIGKWHLESEPTGFDYWDVLPGQGQYYNPDLISAAGRRRVEGYCTEVVTDLAIDWLERGRDADKPFLLMCQHKAPHRPWMPGPAELGLFRDATIPEPATLFDDHQGRGPAAAQHQMGIRDHMYMAYDLQAPMDADETLYQAYLGALKRMTPAQRESWDAAFAAENQELRDAELQGEALVRWKYQRYIKNYLRCVAGVDRSVGQLLDWIDRNGLREDTIFVYASDQGFYLGDHGWYDKRWMYEESFRMPLLVRWPGHAAPGSVCDALVQNIDYAPTFLDAAGATIPATMHGRSLVPLLEGRTPDDWRQSLYYHYYESRATHFVAAHEGVRTDRYKLIHFYEDEHRYWEFYDLEKDPDELRNAVADDANADLVATLKAELARLKRLYGVTDD